MLGLQCGMVATFFNEDLRVCKQITGVAAVVAVVRTCFYMQSANQETGKVVRMVMKVLKREGQVNQFLKILLVIVFGFSICFMLLFSSSPQARMLNTGGP